MALFKGDNNRIDSTAENRHDRDNKRKFQKRRHAKRWIKKYGCHTRTKLRVYECKICGFWHLSSQVRRS